MARRPLRFLGFAVLASAMALGAAWVGAALAGRAKGAAPSATVAASPDEVAELRAELAALRRTAADTQRFVAWQAARTGAAQAVAPVAAAVNARTLPTPEQTRESRRTMRSSLERQYSADGADPAWSAAAVAGMRRTIAAELPGTQVMGAECARTMCRLRLVFKDEEAAAVDTERLGDLEPFASEVQYLPEPDAQPPVTTIYVARAGARLPAIP
jgi:glucose/arabinose dehydrogenase